MKCPKCGYLGFEHVERCRNCGYRFSLSTPASARAPELPLRQADQHELDPLDDLALVDLASSPPPPSPRDTLSRGRNRPGGGIELASDEVPDLPLFSPATADDAPLITRPSPPRQPLAVRRATPEVPRLRTERAPFLDATLPGLEAGPAAPVSERRTMPRGAEAEDRADGRLASIGTRVLAAVIDLALLAGIDAAVIYLTMEIVGVSWSDRAILPAAPLAAFLVAQNFGYFVAFAAGGQTLGQMASGIKIVMEGSERAPALDSALLRTLAWIALLIPAGLGLLTIVFGQNRRGLHDRVAATRVVRVRT